MRYRPGKSNERADALSRKLEDVAAQDKAIEQYRTQVLIPRSKIESKVADNLQLALLEPEPEQEPDNCSYQGTVLDSVKLVEKLVETNRTDPDL